MVCWVNRAVGWGTGLIMGPLAHAGSWAALLGGALASAFLVMLAFRAAQNAGRVRRWRNRCQAGLLEFLLFQDSLRVNVVSCGRVLLAVVGYMGSMLPPMLAGAIPFLLLLPHMEAWLADRPLVPGECVPLTVRVSEGVDVMAQGVGLEGSGGVRAAGEAVRVPALGEATWRLCVGSGSGGEDVEPRVTVRLGAARETIPVAVGREWAGRVARRRVRGCGWAALTSPGVVAMEASSPVTSIEVDYRPRRYAIGHVGMGWLPAYVLTVFLFGWVLSRPLGVEL